MRQLVLVLVAGAFAAGTGGPRAFGQPLLSPVAEAAKGRQDRLKTVDIEFKVRTVLPAGGPNGTLSDQPGTPAGAEKETVVESTDRVVIDGKKFRHETQDVLWVSPRRPWVKLARVNVFDGRDYRILYPAWINGPGEQIGFHSENQRYNHFRVEAMMALNFTFRGLDPSASPYPASDLKPTGATLPVDGAECQEYLATSTTTTHQARYWIDPAIGQLPRQIQIEQGGKPVEHFTVKYRRDEGCGWRPESWVLTTRTVSGAARRMTTGDVTQVVCNSPVQQSLFALSFPPGATVYDEARGGDRYRVQADGTWAVDSPRRESSSPADSWAHQSRDLLAIGALAVVAGLVVLVRAASRAARRNRATA